MHRLLLIYRNPPTSTHPPTFLMASPTKRVRSLHADDTRNSSYYERRAGYPLPDKAFFKDQSGGKRTKVHYMDENLVRGFNLTPGEFYRLRESVIPHLIKDGLYKTDFKDTYSQWDLYAIIDAVMQPHRILRLKPNYNQVAAYWRHNMFLKFLTRVAIWMEENASVMFSVNGELMLIPRDANWSWGSERQHEAFKDFFSSTSICLFI